MFTNSESCHVSLQKLRIITVNCINTTTRLTSKESISVIRQTLGFNVLAISQSLSFTRVLYINLTSR